LWVTGNVRVYGGATLTIPEGMVIKMAGGYFETNTSGGGGKIIARGTVGAPIIFTSTADDSVGGDSNSDGNASAPARADWRGIFLDGDNGSVFEHVEVRYAGADGNSGGITLRGGTPSLRNVTVKESGRAGVRITGGTPTLEGVRIDGSTEAAFSSDWNIRGLYTNLSATRTAGNSFVLTGGDLTGGEAGNWSWGFGSLPLVVTGPFVRVYSGATLTIPAGQVIKMAGGYFETNTSGGGGKIMARGTAAAPIIITSTADDSVGGDTNADGVGSSAARGDWRGLFLDGDTGSLFENVEVRYGGADGNSGAFTLRGGTPTLRNVTVKESARAGVRITGGTPTLDGVQIVGSAESAFFSNWNVRGTYADLTATGTLGNSFVLSGGDLTGGVDGSWTWDFGSLPLEVTGNVRVYSAATLTIPAGQVIKMASGYFQTNPSGGGGKIIARGTAAAPIVFTSSADDTAGGDTNGDGALSAPAPGNWTGFYLDGDTGSQFTNVDIRYAGSDAGAGAFSVRGPTLEVENLTIRESAGNGVFVSSGGALTHNGGLLLNNASAGVRVAGGSFSGSALGFFGSATGVHVHNGSTAAVTGSAFEGNTTAVVHQGSNAANADFRGNWWGDAGGPNDTSAADGIVNANAAGQPVGDFVQYSPFLSVRPALPIGPAVLSVSPTTVGAGGVGEIVIVFSEPVDPSTFTAADIAISGPQGAAVANIVLIAGAAYRATLSATLSAAGDYTIRIGPDIKAAASSFRLDQDRDGVGAEPGQDVFVQVLRIDTAAPVVIGHTPTGTQTQAVTEVILTFNEAMDAATLTPADATLSGPAGPIQVLAVNRMNDTQFRVLFQAQFLNGTYTLTVGPTLADLAGNPMTAAYVGSYVIDRQPLRLVSQTPSGLVTRTTSSVTVAFSAPITPGSFTATDITLRGPRGLIAITGITAVDATTYTFSFAPQSIEGRYDLVIGPDISDAAGILMDQDNDNTPGETEDRFNGGFDLDGAGPYVLSQSATGIRPRGLDHVDVVFSETMLSGSVQLSDFSLTGPAGLVALTGFSALAADTYRVSFAPLTLSGSYALSVGPDLTDLGGTRMDQDNDGIEGEVPEDVWIGSFSLDATPLRVTGTSLSNPRTTPFTNFTVTFNKEVAPASFTAADVDLRGPGQAILAVTVSRIDASTYQISTGSQSAIGTYRLVIGPAISDLAGNAMDQNDNGTAGEVADVFNFDFDLQLPDLVASEVSAPDTAVSGDTITVTWRAANAGNRAADAPWNERVIISATGTPTGPGAQVIVVGTYVAEAPLAIGTSAVRSLEITLPLTLSGNLTIFVWLDQGQDVLPEPDAANNLASRPITVSGEQVRADLVVSLVTAPPAGTGGQSVNVSFTVTNQGTGATLGGAWKDRVYLSTNDTFGGGDILLGERAHSGVLAASGTYTETIGVALPLTSDGTYFIIVVADAANDTLEIGAENNNERASSAVTVAPALSPDLVVTAVTPPSGAQAGRTAEVSYVVRNQGAGAIAAGTWRDRVYLSTDAEFSATDIILSERSRPPPLEAGASYTESFGVVLPAAFSGEFYLIVITDAFNEVTELRGTAETNNSLASAAFTISLPPSADLRVDSVSAPTRVIGDPADATISWTVSNQGSAATAVDRWTDRVVISIDEVVGNRDDTVLGTFEHFGLLPVGATYSDSRIVLLPVATNEWYYVFVLTDFGEAVDELPNTASNTARAAGRLEVMTRPFADLVVESVQPAATTATAAAGWS